ncbi:MAG: MlaD family protein [Deltaproteobacteria bacterium]|jgi:ABC-type transporter Mla subunit MlaD|nr:MlaD family protein [Deltaproteobacteria bacterium]
MSKQTNYFKIGLFSAASLLVLAAGIIFFGLSSAFRPTLECVTFFDHSVQGLSVGAPVNFRGFKVGQVSKIVLPGLTGNTGQKVVEVDFFLYPSNLSGTEKTTRLEARKYLETEIDAGLRIYLTFQGVSGVCFLDLDYNTDLSQEKPIPKYRDPRLMIPNAQGTILEITDSISRIVRSFRSVDFDRLGQRLDQALFNFTILASTLNDKTKDVTEEMTRTLAGLQATSDDIAILIQGLNIEVKDLRLQDKLKEFSGTMNQARQVLARTDQLLRLSQDKIQPALDNFKAVTENFRELSDTAKRYPSQILFGQAPNEVKP